MKKTTVYDNQGKTMDRYTVIFSNNDIYAMSDNPGSPQGVCMYCGTQISLAYLKTHSAKVAINDLPNPVQSKIKELRSNKSCKKNKSKKLQ